MKAKPDDATQIQGNLPYAHINNYNGNILQQRWLVAHNGWNIKQNPPNQVRSVTQLLDHGVRGLALDIHPGSNHSLYLKHNVNGDSYNDWEPLKEEIKSWLEANPTEVVALFFESYLPGPESKKQDCALADLDKSLQEIDCYISGKAKQIAAMNYTLDRLAINGERLFAFIEKTPDEGEQDLFPEMYRVFAENKYGTPSVEMTTWVDLRDDPVDSDYQNPYTFMNHFSNDPVSRGEEDKNNDPFLIIEHAQSFAFRFGGRYPNFISLNTIDWKDANVLNPNAPGPNNSKDPIIASKALTLCKNFAATSYQWEGQNDWDGYIIDMVPDPETALFFVELTVESDEKKGISKINGRRGKGDGVSRIEVYNVPGKGIANLRYEVSGKWSGWLSKYNVPEMHHSENRHVHSKMGFAFGYSCRTQKGYGVTDVAFAFSRH